MKTEVIVILYIDGATIVLGELKKPSSKERLKNRKG